MKKIKKVLAFWKNVLYNKHCVERYMKKICAISSAGRAPDS